MKRWQMFCVALIAVVVFPVIIVLGLWQSGIISLRSSAEDGALERPARTDIRRITAQLSPEMATIMKLIEQREIAAAQKKIDAVLKRSPSDIQGRFFQGVVLAEQGQTEQAIEVFKALTKEHPELPEPFNNLAVLYATDNQYEQARDTLLEAINTHSSYATAYQNLSDIYAIMAGMAYDKALKLWKEDEVPETSLALIITPPSTLAPKEMDAESALIAAADTPARDSDTGRSSTPEPPSQVTPLSSSPESSAREPRTSSAPGSPVRRQAASIMASPPAEGTTRQTPSPGQQQVINAVTAWAQVWSSQDVEAYLAFYAPDFQTPEGQPRQDWEQNRRQRLNAPSFIQVTVGNFKVDMLENEMSRVRFRQIYQSSTFRGRATKVLLFKKIDGQWKIVQEAVG